MNQWNSFSRNFICKVKPTKTSNSQAFLMNNSTYLSIQLRLSRLKYEDHGLPGAQCLMGTPAIGAGQALCLGLMLDKCLLISFEIFFNSSSSFSRFLRAFFSSSSSCFKFWICERRVRLDPAWLNGPFSPLNLLDAYEILEDTRLIPSSFSCSS